METPQNLEKALEEDAEFRFFDMFGNTLFAIEGFIASYLINNRKETLARISQLKNKFYKELEQFEKSGYIPKGKIDPANLKKFYGFQELDWAAEENMEKIKAYLISLKPEK